MFFATCGLLMQGQMPRGAPCTVQKLLSLVTWKFARKPLRSIIQSKRLWYVIQFIAEHCLSSIPLPARNRG